MYIYIYIYTHTNTTKHKNTTITNDITTNIKNKAAGQGAEATRQQERRTKTTKHKTTHKQIT